MKKRDERFNMLTIREMRAGNGTLLDIRCIPEKADEVRKILEESVYRIDTPITGTVKNVPHGGYGAYTRYDATQHKYAGGGCGYIEVLEIKDPPDGRCNIVINEHNGGNSRFAEWDSLESAKKAFERFWGHPNDFEEKLSKMEGFKRFVPCGKLTPWFYAIGDETLIGDYAFPDGLQDDPVYRFGKKFVVFNDNGNMLAVKTCMGTRFIEEEAGYMYPRGKKTLRYRIVYWSDGSTWNERGQPSGSNKYLPRPLEGDELWITEAIQKFCTLLSGNATELTIPFMDGTTFKGKITTAANVKYTKEGRYSLIAHITGKKELQEGYVDFVPSPEAPDILSYVTKKFQEKGKMVERIEVKENKAVKNGKKWAGVFFNKKTSL